MSTTVTVTYECCDRTYSMATALKDDSLLLHQTALADTLLMIADAQHDAECPTP